MSLVLNKPKKRMGLLSLLIGFVSVKQFPKKTDVSVALSALSDHYGGRR